MVLTRKRTGIVEIEEKKRFRTVKRREQVDVYTAPSGKNEAVFAKIAQIAAGLPDPHPTHTGQKVVSALYQKEKCPQRSDMIFS
ncbi:MAG: hypothetical protein J7L37_03595 [Thermococcus sp.]|nr:hypothetical protein [Thermococcus sp.]